LEIKFQDGFFRIKDYRGAPSSANQLITKVYAHPIVYKSNTTAFKNFGIYRGHRTLPIGLCFFTTICVENYDKEPWKRFLTLSLVNYKPYTLLRRHPALC
jgi:hypothetical protein